MRPWQSRKLPGLATLLAAAWLAGSLVCGAASAGTQHRIVIEAMQYSPATLEVRRGDTVIWVNKDPFPHTASADGGEFDSREIPAEGTWGMEAARVGTYPYRCGLHPGMRGVLVVVK